MRRLLLGIVIWAFSVGWPVPTYLAMDWLYGCLRFEILPSDSVQSFPYYAESESMARVAFGWLAAVVGAWALVLTHRVLKRKSGTGS